MITGNWFIKTYECASQYCYFGEWFCLNQPWHIPIMLLLTFFILAGIVKFLERFRRGDKK